jgi:hypothetical protein
MMPSCRDISADAGPPWWGDVVPAERAGLPDAFDFAADLVAAGFAAGADFGDGALLAAGAGFRAGFGAVFRAGFRTGFGAAFGADLGGAALRAKAACAGFTTGRAFFTADGRDFADAGREGLDAFAGFFKETSDVSDAGRIAGGGEPLDFQPLSHVRGPARRVHRRRFDSPRSGW